MRILIDILHPAHVHFFRNFRHDMIERGHEVIVTARDKDVTTDLLEAFDIPHRVISSQRTGRIGLTAELVTRTARLIGIARKTKPDVMTGIMGPSIALAGKLLRVPSVVFYDTELATVTNRWVYPLSTAVCTPDSYDKPVRGDHVTYAGYHDLAYLHPNRFQPDRAKLEAFGLQEPYSLVRFVSWQASHDVAERGLSLDRKMELVDRLKKRGSVVVSSEGPLPDVLEPYRLRGPIADIHHVLAFADVYVGESPTMSSEAAVLGVPSVLIARRSAGVLDDNEKRYGLLKRVSPDDFGSIRSALDNRWTAGTRAEATNRLWDDKIDVTAWIEDFFEKRAWRKGSAPWDAER